MLSRHSRSTRVRTLVGALFAALVAVALVAAPASAGTRYQPSDGRILGDSWKAILELPGSFTDPTAPENPFMVGGCLRFDGVISPLVGLDQATELTCYVRPGERVFVVGRSYEQSAVEQGDPDATAAELRATAISQLGSEPPIVVLDQRRLRLQYVESPLIFVKLPQPNLLGSPLPSTRLVAVGWVTTLRFGSGRHTITITQPGQPGQPTPTPVTTTVIVSHHR